MGVAQLARIVELLRAHGAAPERPAAIVEQATLPGQRVIAGCLGDICAQAQHAQVAAPALLIVGEVARRAAQSADLVHTLLPRGAANA
jgi:siroheme synthase